VAQILTRQQAVRAKEQLKARNVLQLNRPKLLLLLVVLLKPVGEVVLLLPLVAAGGGKVQLQLQQKGERRLG